MCFYLKAIGMIFWTDELYQGGGHFQIKVQEDRIPVFIRAGSVFELDEAEGRLLHIYPQIEGVGSGMSYKDEGDGYGGFHLERYRMHWEASQIVLTKNMENTGFKVDKKRKIECHGLGVSRVWIDEKPKSIQVNNNCFEVKDFSRIRFEFEI